MYFKLKEEAISIIKNGLNKLNIDYDDEIVLDYPPNPDLGDLSSTISFSLAKILKKPPVEIAKQLIEVLSITESFTKVESVGPYINFFIDYNIFSKKLLLKVDENYGKIDSKDKKIVLEHTSANPNGPLHIGHIRNSLFGDSLRRVLSLAGYDIETQYYVNDMGRQIAIIVFGITKLGLKLDNIFELDDENNESESNIDNSDNNNENNKFIQKIDHKLGRLYYFANKSINENPEYVKEVDNLIKQYEAGENEELNKIFESVVSDCLKGVKETLNRMDVYHDDFVWEGQFIRNGKVNEVVDDLIDSGYTKEDEVLVLDLLDDYGIEKDLVLRRSDGTSLYSTRDLAYHIYKGEIGDYVLDVLGSDHKLAAKQISIALEILNKTVPEVIFYEFINLPEGSMSTRKGVFISVDDLIEEAILRANNELKERRPELTQEEQEKIAEIIGIGAIRFYISKISPEKHITFKWDEALNFEKGCASIQYAYARGFKLLSKADKQDDIGSFEDFNDNWHPNENEKNLIRVISKFPLIVEESAKSRRIHHIAQYALDLATNFNKFYKNEQVLEDEFEDIRLLLVKKAILTIKKSLDLLGVSSPESM
ncbi:MAG: arginine--tRNA ligase [Methanobrevibacter sp.]|jgi:arginyl-tRNA synthetase|nr:arginine--tRNA ligase [Candidatus Methanoflexus mossambicus]